MNPDNIIREISPNDEMIVTNSPHELKHYFSVGESALNSIKIIFDITKKNSNDIKNILDLPCGHGRVLRHLKSHFPSSSITVCDLNYDAVDFCAKTFDAVPVYSEKNIEQISIKNKFDLIWCGSLFTHLNIDSWHNFLVFFNSILNEQGILIFTVHGLWVAERMKNREANYGLDDDQVLNNMIDSYECKGFGFSPFKPIYMINQTKGLQENYGISISSPSFVSSYLEKFPNLRLLTNIERGWDQHQDVVAVLRENKPRISL